MYLSSKDLQEMSNQIDIENLEETFESILVEIVSHITDSKGVYLGDTLTDAIYYVQIFKETKSLEAVIDNILIKCRGKISDEELFEILISNSLFLLEKQEVSEEFTAQVGDILVEAIKSYEPIFKYLNIKLDNKDESGLISFASPISSTILIRKKHDYYSFFESLITILGYLEKEIFKSKVVTYRVCSKLSNCLNKARNTYHFRVPDFVRNYVQENTVFSLQYLQQQRFKELSTSVCEEVIQSYKDQLEMIEEADLGDEYKSLLLLSVPDNKNVSQKFFSTRVCLLDRALHVLQSSNTLLLLSNRYSLEVFAVQQVQRLCSTNKDTLLISQEEVIESVLPILIEGQSIFVSKLLAFINFQKSGHEKSFS